MPEYTVQQGDTVSSIAAANGLANWRAIYDHPANADFRALRPDENLIYPGDVVFVPDRERPDYPAASSQVHEFELRRPRNQLVLRLLDGYGEPLSEVDYTLDVAESVSGTTDDEGMLEHPIPVDAVQGSISYLGATVDLQIGWLDPIETVAGVKGRLQNLGYGITTIDDDETSEEYQQAVTAFQEEKGLEASGEMNDETRDALREAYGS